MRSSLVVVAATLASCGIDARGTSVDPGITVPDPDGGASSDASTLGSDGGTSGPYVAAVLADAPIAYWRLEEASGPNAADARGTYPATVDPSGVFGRPGALSSQPSTALKFDGAATVISAPAPMPFDGTKPFTIEAWIRPLYVDGSTRWFFAWGHPTGGLNGAIQLSGANGNIHFVRTAPDGSEGFYASTTLAFGVFTHVVITYDGNVQRFYKDAVEAKNAPSAVALGGPAGFEVRWGTNMNGNFFKYDGEMDELALYDRALSPARVKAHYDAR